MAATSSKSDSLRQLLAVTYLRRSSDNEGQQASIPDQRAAVQKYAEERIITQRRKRVQEFDRSLSFAFSAWLCAPLRTSA